LVDKYRQSLESTTILRPPTEYVQVPTVPNGASIFPKEDPTLQQNAKPIVKPINAQPEKPEPAYPPYGIPAMQEPAKPAVAENPPAPKPLVPSVIVRGGGIQLEGMDNILESDPGTASGSAKQPAPATEPGLSLWLPALREIKSRIEQFTQGRIERVPHPDQVRVPRCSPEKESYVFLSHCPEQVICLSFASPLGRAPSHVHRVTLSRRLCAICWLFRPPRINALLPYR
jgi:hypothetical protein